jgi:predicted GNAT family N-acyltransferase
MIEGKWLTGRDDLSIPLAIRDEVFVQEQGFSKELEQDSTDAIALHAVVWVDGEAVATGRVYDDKGVFHIGRIAVRKPWRGTGLGDILVRMLLLKARSLGAGDILLGAQLPVVNFYAKYGFRAEGTTYFEEHCEHQNMRLAAEVDPFSGPCHGSRSL